MILSICIPTFNRAHYLNNCLHSIIKYNLHKKLKFQVCVSDNCSTDNTEQVVKKAKRFLDIKYLKNPTNFGVHLNFLKVVSMADGEFIWMIGDDDLLMPYAIENIFDLINKNPNVDFFYVNSFHLSTDYIEKFTHPFDTKNLPIDMKPFSKRKIEGELPFYELINPNISFDFLGGIFLSVFKKKNWIENTFVLDKKALSEKQIFSHFDNTFPHIKIFSRAFANSKAYFNVLPLNVCITGAREWSHMSPLIMSVRLVEALEEYRKNGLSFWQYVYCKNYALRNFIPDFINMFIHRKNSGYAYINPLDLILKNFLYPNFYLSFFYFFGRRVLKLYEFLFGFFNSRK